jgi:hypothetical protein
MRTYPQLTYLAQAYFHQDYDLEAPAPSRIIANFADTEEPGATRELAAEIKTILNSDMTETQISDLWVTALQASYEPAHDGLTTRAWLTTILDTLEQT